MNDKNQKPESSNQDSRQVSKKLLFCPMGDLSQPKKTAQWFIRILGRIREFIRFLHNPKQIFPRADIKRQLLEYPSLDDDLENIWQQVANNIHKHDVFRIELLKKKNRPWVCTFLFRLMLGLGFYKHGFILDYGRREGMQKLKNSVVEAQIKRIDRNLGGKLHERLEFNISPFLNGNVQAGLQQLVNQLTSDIIHEILDLPKNLDFSIAGRITKLHEELIQCIDRPFGVCNTFLVALGLKETILPCGSQLLTAQRYLRDFVDSKNWSNDSYCADVISAGERHKIDARGCLAELLMGLSFNTENVFLALAWHVLKSDNSQMFFEIKKAVEERQDWTDSEFLKDRESRAFYWVNWIIMKHGNVATSLRVTDSGVIFSVDLKSMDDLNPDSQYTVPFGIGRFSCPGQYVARTTMLLALRSIFSPIAFGGKKYQILPSPAGVMTAKYHTEINIFSAQWTDDNISFREI